MTSGNPAAPLQLADIQTFGDLNSAQSQGWECVTCWTALRDPEGGADKASVVVGRSRSTGKPVRACAGRCAVMVGWRPDPGWRQDALL